MAYVKTVWKTGDVITAEKLNNAEGGIEAHDPLICQLDLQSGALDQTWQAIYDKLAAGGRVIILTSDEYESGQDMIVSAYITGETQYDVIAVGFSVDGASSVVYTATSADGYPAASTP